MYTSIGLTYLTADNLAVLPENDGVMVDAVAATLGYDLKQVVVVEGLVSNFKHTFPSPCTIRDILTKYFDLQCVPRISVLEQLMPYVMNPSQRQWLIDVLSPTDKHMAYKVQIEAACRSMADLIANSLSSLNIPLADLLHIIPHMQPRYYTISSSSNCYPHSVHITVSVHEFVNQEGKEFKGLCSSYLQV